VQPSAELASGASARGQVCALMCSQRAKPTTRAGLASALHSAKRRSRRQFVYPDAHLAMRQAVRIILKSKEEPPWP